MKQISFLNRDSIALCISFQKLKERYNRVEITRKLVRGLYSGYFSVSN